MTSIESIPLPSVTKSDQIINDGQKKLENNFPKVEINQQTETDSNLLSNAHLTNAHSRKSLSSLALTQTSETSQETQIESLSKIEIGKIEKRKDSVSQTSQTNDSQGVESEKTENLSSQENLQAQFQRLSSHSNDQKIETDQGNTSNPQIRLKHHTSQAILIHPSINAYEKKPQQFILVKGTNYTQLFLAGERIHLGNLYFTKSQIKFNFSKFNYYHSLVPKLTSLKKNKRIHFHISKTSTITKQRLLPENSINIHLFKPFYVEDDNQIICYVPTRQIMKHAMMALYHVHECYGIPHPSISMQQSHTTVSQLVKGWKINDRVIICRVQSLLTYLLIQWMNVKNVPVQVIHAVAIEIQKSRLNPKRIGFQKLVEMVLEKHSLSKSEVFEYYKIKKQTSPSIFIYGYDFQYKNVQISAVMLPWGLDLAEELTRQLYKINPEITHLGVVGGVGYIGNQKCEVDQIFLPDSFMVGDEEGHQIQTVENQINQKQDIKHFSGFNVTKGTIKSVFPEIGKLSSIQAYRKILHKIDAFDMQFQTIYRVVQENPKSKLGAIYYIMDLPKNNVHLGDTYYTLSFLQDLFQKFKRGKHFCFEKTVQYLSS